MANIANLTTNTDLTLEKLLDAEFERIDDEIFEEDRRNLEENGRVFPAPHEVQPSIWAVNSAGHCYNPHPVVCFRRFSVNDRNQRIAHFSFVAMNGTVRQAVRTAIIDYDLEYAPLIGKTMRITMRQDPTQWYILDPKAVAKPKVERATYTFSDAEDAQYAKLLG